MIGSASAFFAIKIDAAHEILRTLGRNRESNSILKCQLALLTAWLTIR